MQLCIFGAASNDIDGKYISAVEHLGESLAKNGHDLVFGAGRNGLMGAAARGFTKENGKITGVIPEFFKEAGIEAIYEKCNDLIFTDSMRERKAKMEDKADAFIIVPGGIGTFEEFFEVLTLKQLGRHTKPIAIYNIDGYYNALEALMKHAVEEGFVSENCNYLYRYFTDEMKLISYIEENKQYDFSVDELKNG